MILIVFNFSGYLVGHIQNFHLVPKEQHLHNHNAPAWLLEDTSSDMPAMYGINVRFSSMRYSLCTKVLDQSYLPDSSKAGD